MRTHGWIHGEYAQGLHMKKIVCSVLAVVPARDDGGVAARSCSDGVSAPPVMPASGMADGITLARDGRAAPVTVH